MRALLYLTKRSMINNLKKAVKKPLTLLVVLACAAYAVFLAVMLAELAVQMKFDSAKGMVIILTVWSLYLFLLNFMSYASRKGILFCPAHAHFIFNAPVDPKVVLIHGAWMNYLSSVVFFLIFIIAGITVFDVSPWRILLFAGICICNLALEISLMVCLYSSERISEKAREWIGRGIKVFLLMVTGLIVLYFWKKGVSFAAVSAFFDWPILRMIPIIGWEISAFHLILLSPDLLNAAGMVLYLLTTILLVILAYRMPCNGDYYEDAAKFADTYAEMIKRKKNGEMVMGLEEKKKKFRHMTVRYQAVGAKAIFYRQLLEYRKERTFIFSKMTLLNLGIGIVMAFAMRETAQESGIPQIFLLGILAYMTLIFSGYLGKWETEIKTPYLYLIPDSPVKKLWYSTLMEHVKAFVDGVLLCVPIGILWKVNVLEVILGILIYTILQANRMYSKVLAQCVVGDVLGRTGQDVVRAFFQMFVLGIGVMVAALAGIFISMDLVFPIALIYSMIVTVIIGLIAAIRFDSMEQMA